ncbi:hypothetical protein [Acidocella sp.]
MRRNAMQQGLVKNSSLLQAGDRGQSVYRRCTSFCPATGALKPGKRHRRP